MEKLQALAWPRRVNPMVSVYRERKSSSEFNQCLFSNSNPLKTKLLLWGRAGTSTRAKVIYMLIAADTKTDTKQHGKALQEY
jgi:hypothetical protein